jgi:AraC-like DNA-binding protein/Tfp pilus assembly protein PilF
MKRLSKYLFAVMTLTAFAVSAQTGHPVQEDRIRDLLNRAGACYYESDYRTSYELLLKALSEAEKSGNTDYEAQIYANMGNIYGHFNELGLMKRYYLRALALYRDTTSIIATLNNLGGAELAVGQADSAFHYLSRAMEISSRHDGKSLYSIQNNIALYYHKKRDYDSAAKYFRLSLEEARRSGIVEKEAEVLSNISEMQFDLGRIDSALYYGRLSNSIAKEQKFLAIAAQNYLTISRIAESQGDQVRAFANFRRHVELKDSLVNSQKHGEINQLQRLYETSKSDARIAGLELEQRIKERTITYQWVVSGVVSAALFVVVLILVHVFRQKRELNRAHQALVQKNLQIIGMKEEGKYSKSALTHDRHGELLEKILEVMEDRSVICDPKFNIDKLAELTSSNQTYVSQVINLTQQKNFRAFLNGYRIREAQQILSEPDASKYTIEAIAMQVGFNSRSTFREAFQEVTGVTPSFYMKFLLDRRQ